jgi:hypothetical protein
MQQQKQKVTDLKLYTDLSCHQFKLANWTIGQIVSSQPSPPSLPSIHILLFSFLATMLSNFLRL